MTKRVDVVIIGAGVMGSAAAWWLARQGASVVALEQFEAGHNRGSSHGRSRIFRLAYPDPKYVHMAQQSQRLWFELQEEAGTSLIDVTGGIDFGDPSGVEGVSAALRSCGASFEIFPAEAAEERWAAFRLDSAVLFQPDAGRLRADACVAAFQRGAEANGAELRFKTPVVSISPGGNGVEVVTRSSSISARVAVVTAGAWLPTVVGSEIALPPLKVTEEAVFHFTPKGDGSELPPFIDHRAPYMYGLMTPGEGMKVAEHHAGAVVDPDQRTGVIDPAARARVVEYVHKRLPGLDPAPHHEATCLYTTTPDESFVVGRQGPLIIGSPCSGHGFKFAPLIGRRLAELALS